MLDLLNMLMKSPCCQHFEGENRGSYGYEKLDSKSPIFL